MTDRSTGERAALARMRLESEANVWIASASAAGIPHLVPLSLAWIDEHIVVATPSDTPTARNAAANGRVCFCHQPEPHHFPVGCQQRQAPGQGFQQRR